MDAPTVVEDRRLDGRTALITGANSGIGLETAGALAEMGARIVLACRDLGRAQEARVRVRDRAPEASVDILHLDLASGRSVREAAGRFAASHDRLDLLVNNAGIMAPPAQRTEDGHELQMATNHLGHVALTAELLDHLLTTPGARVVTVTSVMHRFGHVDAARLGDPGQGRWRTYSTSKLANLLFAFELQRRFTEIGADALSLAAHPGWSKSNLAATGPVAGGSAARARIGRFAAARLGQSTVAGALAVVYAATAPDLPGGVCVGPTGAGQLRGAPGIVATSARSRDVDLARAAFDASERLTGLSFPFEVERGLTAGLSPRGGGGRSPWCGW